MVRFSKQEMNKAKNTIQKSIKKNNKLPTFVTMTDMDKNKKYELSQKEYAGLFEAQNIFWLKKGRQPNYITKNATANNPLVLDYQDSKMSCACASTNMAIQMLYGYIDEKTICKAFGTDKNKGTAPSQIINNAHKLGLKIQQIPRNRQAVQNCLKLQKPVIAHIDTIKANCLGYQNNYGHYTLIYGINGDYYKIADSTKGLKQCKCNTYDKAMKNRTLHYYSVSLI